MTESNDQYDPDEAQMFADAGLLDPAASAEPDDEDAEAERLLGGMVTDGDAWLRGLLDDNQRRWSGSSTDGYA